MKQNKQRKAAGFLAALLVIALILSLAAPIFTTAQAMPVTVEKSNPETEGSSNTMLAAQEKGQEQFLLEMKAGYAESYILGRPTPFQGVLTNLGSDFNGEIQIKAYSSYEEYNSDVDKKYTIYYQPLELAKGAKKQVNLKVTADAIHKYFQVILVNSQGETVFLKNIAIQAMEPATSFVGVLTDSAQDLAYLSGLKLAENGEGDLYASKTIYMDENIFPEDADFLKNFGIVIIDDFDTKLLSTEQKDALKSWVQAGGTLVLGTGAKAEKVLAGLTNITTFQIEEKKKVHTLANLGYLNGHDEVDITPILGEGLKEVYQEKGVGITSAMTFGVGNIIVHNFSLSSAPITTIPDVAMALRSMYVNIVPSLKVSQFDTENIANIQYIADNFPAFKTEGIYTIFICILIYLVFIGPILYYFLKKKDKREWGWVALPVFSLVFMGIVFLLSQNSLYRKDIMNIVSITDINQNTSVTNTRICAALKSSSSGDVTLTMEEPIPLSFYDSYRGWDRSSGKEKPIRKILSGESTEVTFYDNQSWATNTFMTNTSIDLGGGFESTISMDGNVISGEVINHTNLDFYGVVIGTAGHFQRFDQLKAGESLKFSYNMKEIPSRKGIYEMVNEIYDEINDRAATRKRIKEGTLSVNEAYELYQQKNLVEDSLQIEYYQKQENFETGILPIVVYAFNDIPVLPQKKYVNGDLVLERNLGFYRCKFDLDLSRSGEVSIPFGLIYPARFEADFTVNRDVYTNYLYPDKSGEVDCIFQMPKGIEVSTFQIRTQADLVSFSKEPEIYHVATNTWEPLKAEEYQNVEEYLTDDGAIRVRIFINEVREVAMPEIRLKGRGNNAGN